MISSWEVLSGKLLCEQQSLRRDILAQIDDSKAQNPWWLKTSLGGVAIVVQCGPTEI
jgi:hypothetical protein